MKKLLILIITSLILPLGLTYLTPKLVINEIEKKPIELVSKPTKVAKTKTIKFNKYAYKLELKINTDKDISIKVNNQKLKFSPYINERSIKIDKQLKKIKIKTAQPVKIQSLAIDNTLHFNLMLYLFYLVLTILITTIILYHDYLFKKVEWLFVLICLSSSILFSVLGPLGSNITPDDLIHYENAYEMLDGKTSIFNDSIIELKQVPNKEAFKEDEYKDYVDNLIEKQTNPQPKTVINFIPYNKINYLPAAIGIEIGGKTPLGPVGGFIFGRLLNALIYTLIGYIILRNCKYAKNIYFMLFLLPSSVILANAYSLDGLTYSCLLGSTSLFLNIINDENSKINFNWLFKYLLLTSIGCLTKAIFAPMLLLPLFVKNKHFENKKQAIILKIGFIILFLMMCFTFVLPMFSKKDEPGDSRGGMVNPIGQIHFIFTHLKDFILMFSYQVFNIFPEYLFNPATYASYYYLGPNKILGFVYLVLLIYLVISDKSLMINNTWKYRFIYFSLFILMSCFILGAMYLSFTPVASLTINGVQSRYFLPILMLLIMAVGGCLSKVDIFNNKQKYIFTTIVVIIVIVGLFISQYFYMAMI